MAFTREWIIAELQRVATEGGGVTPGRRAFERATGIKEADYLGRYWARWSDAIAEAGLTANSMSARIADEDLIRILAEETRRVGHFPTYPELSLRGRNDPAFPNARTFQKRGNRAELVRLVLEFCKSHNDYADLIPIVDSIMVAAATARADDSPAPPPESEGRISGYVYLVKSGRYYKVGLSTDVQRRMLQLNTGMPEAGELVHTISTDDPAGIERYWHARFADKRVRPDAEWFDLTSEEVRAFKRRRFQ